MEKVIKTTGVHILIYYTPQEKEREMSESNRLFKFSLPFHVNQHVLRSQTMYVSGVLYSLGFWLMIDASIFSKTLNASVVHVTFVDWIPFICSTLGMIVINSLDKVQLISASSSGFESGGAISLQWQARIVLFIGFSLIAVGFNGSFLILVLKFLMKGYTYNPTIRMGTENVGANVCVMISCTILWIVSTLEDDNSLSL